MNDPVIITLIIRGVIAFLLVLVGAMCVYLGWRLLFTKKQNKIESSFEANIGGHEFSFSAGTAGTAVVFTSAIWVIGAVLTAPTLENSGGTTVAFGNEIIKATGLESIAAIEFKENQVSLKGNQISTLDSFVTYLESIKNNTNIIIEGYSDNNQSEQKRKITGKRIEAVKNYMVSVHKIDPSQIKILSTKVSKAVQEINKNAVILTATSSKEDG